MKKATVSALVAATLLSGCIMTPIHSENPIARERASYQITCSTQSECDKLWDSATKWVAGQSKLPLSSSSSVFVQSAPSYDQTLSYTLRRTPTSHHQTIIDVKAGCKFQTYVGCKPDSTQAVADLKDHLRLLQAPRP